MVFNLDPDSFKRYHPRWGFVWWENPCHNIMFPRPGRSAQHEGASCYRDQVWKSCSYYNYLTHCMVIILMFSPRRDLVLSHLIKLESDEFIKKHCDSVTPAPAPNNVSSNQNPGMLASQPRTSRRIIQRDNLRRYSRRRAREHTWHVSGLFTRFDPAGTRSQSCVPTHVWHAMTIAVASFHRPTAPSHCDPWPMWRPKLYREWMKMSGPQC